MKAPNIGSNSRTTCAGQFLSCGLMVLLRKRIQQHRNLNTAAKFGVWN